MKHSNQRKTKRGTSSDAAEYTYRGSRGSARESSWSIPAQGGDGSTVQGISRTKVKMLVPREKIDHVSREKAVNRRLIPIGQLKSWTKNVFQGGHRDSSQERERPSGKGREGKWSEGRSLIPTDQGLIYRFARDRDATTPRHGGLGKG